MSQSSSIIAANFKHHRKLKSLTQEEFADKMKIKRSTFALKEKNGEFTVDELAQASKIFGIPKNELEIDHGRATKSIKIDDVASRILEASIETIASQRTILSILAEMNSPDLKTTSKALADIYRKMVRDEAALVTEELQRK